MAQTRVFSWKINGNKYGYLYISEEKTGNKLITDRITDPEILRQIADEVSSWDKDKYATKFNELNSTIKSAFSCNGIPGSVDDYFNGETEKYIILTGKDGYNNNSTGGSSLNEETVEKIKSVVKSEMAKAKSELQTTVDSVKNYTIGVFTEKINVVNEEMETYKNAVLDSNTELSQRFDDASTKMETAASLFNAEGTGVNIENMRNAIEQSSEALGRLDTVDSRLEVESAQISSLERGVSDLNESTSNLDANLNSLTTSINNRFDSLSANVVSLTTKVSALTTTASAAINDYEQEEQALSKGFFGAYEDAAYTETIDNGDGTYNIVTNIGEENYSIKLYGHGKKIKSSDTDDGLILASNGFRYKDVTGSIISMINGNIVLSNSDGSGKLEIKKDGIYINGNKQ